MFEFYDRLPEWLRWILFLPTLQLLMIISGTILRFINTYMAGSFLFERIFFPMTGSMFLVTVASHIIPRGKNFIAYLLCTPWVGLILLNLFSIFILPSIEGGMTWRELVQCSFGLGGSLIGVKFVRNNLQ